MSGRGDKDLYSVMKMQKTSLLTIKDNQTAFIPYLVAGHTSNEVFSKALRLLK